MKKISLAITLIILLFCSCQSKSKHIKELYANGSIKCEYDTIGKGIRNGMFKSYYESGKIKETGQYLKGKEIGWFIEYSENGKISRKIEYVLISKDSVESLYSLDFVNNNHNLKKKVSYINRAYFFNEKGLIDYHQSYFYSIKMEDTIRLGDTLHFHFKLDIPFIKTAGRGRFIYKILDSNGNHEIHIPTKPPVFLCKICPKKRGIGYIYGTVMEIDDTARGFFQWYVKEMYFVK